MKTEKYKHGSVPRRTGMARLWELALRKNAPVLASCALAVLNTAASFTPFIAVYRLIRELAGHAAGLGRLDAAYMIRPGWFAACVALVKAGGRYSRMWEQYAGTMNWGIGGA
ncbi:MAG: hypothetical protein LBO80_00275 [Treponema sp.]|nr:hypothetical protein [Treponema sp.]